MASRVAPIGGPKSHPLANYLLGVGLTVLVLVGGVTTYFGVTHVIATGQTSSRQQALAPFYLPPAGWSAAAVGTLLRSEPVGGVPAGGLGWRILYVSQDAAGTKVVSSGLVFAPGHGSIPSPGRNVVAWAHPTVGMGDQCAPSRTVNVESDIPGLADFLASGWVVAATDYAGLGTPGTEQYLVGAAEAHDVLNSVRAARAIRAAHAGTSVAVFGHSQGGQAALWAADDASYAPELSLVGVAAAAPAAELGPLIDHQWPSIYGSLIGAEVLVAYPSTYPTLRLRDVTSRPQKRIAELADRCIIPAMLDIVASKVVGGGPLLDHNPLTEPGWRAALMANTPPTPSIPTLIVQGTDDPIVLPGTNALYVQRACATTHQVTAVFIGALGHMKAGVAAAPIASTWFQQRFSRSPAGTTCDTRLPVPPLR